jgi:PPE-repeat protein
MGIDFGALPPEINSARIYAGPGSASLMTAASAWNGLAAELNSAALGYDKVVTTLSSEEWLGPASASMAAAVQPHVAWMTKTAAQAEQAATQAQGAAAAYETALASVVPPPVIATNRTTLAQAVATNVLGQNNGVIAQLEAEYGEMWAHDATAMYSYAGQSATATKVTPFTAAPQTTDPAGTATQAAATAAAADPAASSIQSSLQGLLANIQKSLGKLATPSGTTSELTSLSKQYPGLTEIWFLLTGQTVFPSNLGTFINGYSPYASFFYNTEGLPYFSVGMGNFGVQISKSAGWIGGAAAPAIPKAVPGLGGLGGMLGGGAGAAAHVTGAMGNAGSVGKLSVPVAWSGAAPAVSHAAAVPVSSVSAAPEATGGPGNLLGGMPLAGMGSGAGHGAGPRYGFRPTVMARPPFAG